MPFSWTNKFSKTLSVNNDNKKFLQNRDYSILSKMRTYIFTKTS